ncbi:MAG: hypothetical protein ACL93V_17100 [Candidatus Electrothrix sp. YB6]
MEEKIELYLAKGAKEVWLVHEKGDTECYTCEGRTDESAELPG